jgi:hypothetical protein
MNISGLSERLTKDERNALTQFYPLWAKSTILKEFNLSPLIFAILYERSHMIESLLASGGSVNGDYPGRAIAPIHFAAMLDSLEMFKCLESHGADLSLTDDKSLNVINYLFSRIVRRELGKSLLRYLVEHRTSYLQYSWSSNPTFMKWKV